MLSCGCHERNMWNALSRVSAHQPARPFPPHGQAHCRLPATTTMQMANDKLNSVDFKWFIVRTPPRQERKLAAMLELYIKQADNILEVYCPANTTVSVCRGGREEQAPLFAGFVFVLATRRALADFIGSRYPEGTLLYAHRQAEGRKAELLTVPEGQMRAFRDFNENYADRLVVLERPYSDYAFNPKTGEPNEVVRVVDGPLAGREGYIARFRRDKRLVFNMKVPGRDAHLAVAIPHIWDFHVVRLHNAEGDRLSIGTEKGRAADLLIGMLQACGYGGRTPAMLAGIVGRLVAKPSLGALAAQLARSGHGELARRLAAIGPADASLLANLVRYEAHSPGYVAANWGRATLRPFLTPTAGVETGEGSTEAELAHEGFTEVIRKVDITEDVYYPTTGKDATITTTYYAHIGIMPAAPSPGGGEWPPRHGAAPSPHGGEPQRGFIVFANWDGFLGEYFLTAGKANQKLVSGGTQAAGDGAKLIDSFRNYAPTLYSVLAGAASPVKAVQGLKVGGEALNAMAMECADPARATDELVSTCVSICREVNTTTHLAIWRRYLRTVWLHQ